jgi:phage terminase small subunit
MLTQKKRLYVQARLGGKNQTDSAIFAGCPESTARQAASRYEKDPEVIAHMARIVAGEPEPTPKPKPRPKIEKEVFQRQEVPETLRVSDPLEYMRRVMDNETEDPKLRMEAAKTLAAYLHAKPGEKGKKEQKQEDAERVASRFRASMPPKLVAAGGMKV